MTEDKKEALLAEVIDHLRQRGLLTSPITAPTKVWVVVAWEPYEGIAIEKVFAHKLTAHLYAMRLRQMYAEQELDRYRLYKQWTDPHDYARRVDVRDYAIC